MLTYWLRGLYREIELKAGQEANAEQSGQTQYKELAPQG